MNLLAKLQVNYNSIRKKWRMILFWFIFGIILIGLFASYNISWNTEAFSQIQKIKQSKNGDSITRHNGQEN